MATLKECFEQLPRDMIMIDVCRLRVDKISNIINNIDFTQEPIYEVGVGKDGRRTIGFIKGTVLFMESKNQVGNAK